MKLASRACQRVWKEGASGICAAKNLAPGKKPGKNLVCGAALGGCSHGDCGVDVTDTQGGIIYTVGECSSALYIDISWSGGKNCKLLGLPTVQTTKQVWTEEYLRVFEVCIHLQSFTTRVHRSADCSCSYSGLHTTENTRMNTHPPLPLTH